MLVLADSSTHEAALKGSPGPRGAAGGGDLPPSLICVAVAAISRLGEAFKP